MSLHVLQLCQSEGKSRSITQHTGNAHYCKDHTFQSERVNCDPDLNSDRQQQSLPPLVALMAKKDPGTMEYAHST